MKTKLTRPIEREVDGPGGPCIVRIEAGGEAGCIISVRRKRSRRRLQTSLPGVGDRQGCLAAWVPGRTRRRAAASKAASKAG